MTRLILHIGLPKTGSSAIQLFLASHRSLLETNGIFYQSPEVQSSVEIISGNATDLLDLLRHKRFIDAERFLLAHVAADGLSLLSAENLSRATAEEWAALKVLCRETGIEIERIIFFIRDVEPFLISAYDQLVKRHGAAVGFSQWARKCEWMHYNACRAVDAVFEAALLCPLHYDTCKENLLATFFAEICCVTPELDKQIKLHEGTRVNRSLTACERKYLEKINSVFGAVFSQRVSDEFIYRSPHANAIPVPVDDATRNFIQDRFCDQVAWVNAHLFQGRPGVSCFRNTVAQATAAPQLSQEDGCHQVVAEWLLAEFSVAHSTVVQSVCSRLLDIMRSPQGDISGLPDDFDAIHYALINPDVLIAGVDPREHFLLHGRKEGRAYKYRR